MSETKELDQETVQLFKDLFDKLNHMGNEDTVTDALKYVLAIEHRTLQQNFMKHVVVPAIIAFALKKEQGNFDLRNEASVELASKLAKIAGDARLPFI